MIFSANGLNLFFNKTTFGVERLTVDGDPELLSWVRGKTFGLPIGNNFLLDSTYEQGTFVGKFLFFSEVTCHVTVTARDGTISFRYLFKNEGKQKVELSEGDLGIYAPFNDHFDEPELSLRRRVHAHVRTQGCAFVYCERYSGDMPSLAFVMTEGECFSYELERGAGEGTRGEIMLRFPAMTLNVGETYACEFLLFPCHDRDDFFRKADEYGFLTVRASDLSVFSGEEILLSSSLAQYLEIDSEKVSFEGGRCRFVAKGIGEHRAKIFSDKQSTELVYYVIPDDLIENRIRFVTERQYLSDGAYEGAFTAYDHRSGDRVVRSGVRSPFCLGGFRATPLLLLLREARLGSLSADLLPVVERSLAFYDREIYRGGEVSDDVGGKRTTFFKRYYNYPLFAAIKYEEYRYGGDLSALMQAAVILCNLYKSGSVYEVTPARQIVEALREREKNALADELIECVKAAADRLIAEGNKYAPFKGLPYGPEIVYGALSTLLDAYFLTGKEYYLMTAKEHLLRLECFAFPSVDYATADVPEIFQRDRGNGLIYDMSPHFTAVHFAVLYEKYYQATKEVKYLDLARRITKACLSLFDENGGAHRSKSAPRCVNGQALSSKEEISYGEDVVLYHYDLLFGRK